MKHHLSAALPVAALLLLFHPPSPPPARAPGDRRVAVVFRYDDFSAKSDTSLEARILRAFTTRGMRFTFGVIPAVAARSVYGLAPEKGIPLPPEKIRMLRDALGDHAVEVAQHGYTHQAIRLRIGGRDVPWLDRFHTEFFGVGRERQMERIARGRAILEEAFQVPIETFIPPWNGYDWNTLSVLEELGFKNLSAAREEWFLSSTTLKLLPSTCNPADLLGAVESARQAEDTSPLVVVVLHQYDFRESGSETAGLDFPAFERILDWISGQPDVRVMTLSEAGRMIRSLDPSATMAGFATTRAWLTALPLL